MRFAVVLALLAAPSSAAPAARLDPFTAPAGLSAGKLDCSVETFPVHLNFFFRFEAAFLLSCPVRQFEGQSTRLELFARITPESHPPVVVGSFYNIPAIPVEARAHISLERVRTAVEVTDGFAVGEGQYSVELLAIDNRHREFRHRWKVRAARSHAERSVDMTLAPDTVSAMESAAFDSPRDARPLRSVTLLVNAAPIFPAARKLRAWDRAFLLGAISSVLHGVPARSVRLVAFNLDQQRQVFQSDDFREQEMPGLDTALRTLELGVISVDKLKTEDGWIELLRGLDRQERSRDLASDAVIFVGPWTRRDADSARFALREPCRGKPRFFNIVYYGPFERGREFTDGIQRLTNLEDGVSYRIHSPGELAAALRKLNQQLQQNVSSVAPGQP